MNTEYRTENLRKSNLLSGNFEERFGKERAKEVRQRLSIAHIGLKLSDETKRKMSLASLGKPKSEEHKRKLSKIKKRLFREGFIPWMKGKHHTELARKKMKEGHWSRRGLNTWSKNRKFSEEHKEKIRLARAKQITPLYDTKIELKIQNFLKQLGVEHFTHWFVRDIEHKYNCDIFIPVQNGIPQKTIIECDGDYWHANPKLYSESELSLRQTEQKQRDIKRTKELLENGYNIIRLWENEIEIMNLEKLKEVLYNQLNVKQEVKNGI